MQLMDRLGSTAIGLIVAAILVLVLLVWRVAVMIGRERPVAVPRRSVRKRGADDNEPLGHATLSQSTDWGFDQNKRAALSRSPAPVATVGPDLQSLEQAATQWTMSDVENAKGGVRSDDSLGKSFQTTAGPYRTSFNPYFTGDAPASRMEVVEVADTLMQADLLVQLGDPKQAMTLLSHHIRDTEKPGPAAWLMLLNLYQSTGREKQYNTLAAGFRTLFNAEVPPWATTPDVAARDLESYPQVIVKLQAIWPGPQARPILEGMLNDDRGGSRQGFSLAAYDDLLFLVQILDALEAIDVDETDRQGIRRKLGNPPG